MSSTTSSSRSRSSSETSTEALSSVAGSASPTNSITPTSGFSAVQSTPSPTSTDTGGGGGGIGLASSSSLYLYTFLATLVLLLGVSAAIVIRSYFLRRRHQALVEEAIRNGTWVPPTTGGWRRRNRVDIGEKPNMWDAWIGGHGAESEEDIGMKEKAKLGNGNWNEILPISAKLLNPPSNNQTDTSSPNSPSLNSSESQPPRRVRDLFLSPWRHYIVASAPGSPRPSVPASPQPSLLNLASSSSSPPAATGEQIALTSVPSSNPQVRVTVLIAMPTPPSARKPNRVVDDEEGPPVVEFGVMDIDVTRSGTHSPATPSSSSHEAPRPTAPS